MENKHTKTHVHTHIYKTDEHIIAPLTNEHLYTLHTHIHTHIWELLTNTQAHICAQTHTHKDIIYDISTQI